MDDKHYKVIISERAKEMLIKHIHFLAEVNLEAADRLREEIIAAAKSLQHFPKRNSWLSDPLLSANKYRKLIINKRYLLIYQIKDDTVYIDYIKDCRQSYRWLL